MDVLEQLILDAHNEVDLIRKGLGLPPWVWSDDVSNKHKKKRRLQALTKSLLHKEASRAAIGTVRRTSFIPSRKRGTGSMRSKHVPDPIEEPLDHDKFLHVTEEREMVPSIPTSRMVPPKGYLVSKTTTFISSDRRDTELKMQPVKTYTPQVLSHADFLLKSQGPMAVARYLQSLNHPPKKEEQQVTLLATKEARSPQLGSLDQAIKEAMEKRTFYEKRAREDALEVSRWTLVEQQLTEVLKLTLSLEKVAAINLPPKKAPASVHTNGEDKENKPSKKTAAGKRGVVEKGWHTNAIKEILKEKGGIADLKDVQTSLKSRYHQTTGRELSDGAMYQAIKAAVDKKQIERDMNVISLPEQTQTQA